jgi:hypothetical protein
MNRQAGPDSVIRGSGGPTQAKRQPLLNQPGETEPLADREGLGFRQ